MERDDQDYGCPVYLLEMQIRFEMYAKIPHMFVSELTHAKNIRHTFHCHKFYKVDIIPFFYLSIF